MNEGEEGKVTNGSELLAPAGDFETALAAFEAGADAVYCGLNDFSARAFAKNFSFEELENLLAYARKHEKKVYVTFNTLLDEDQFDGAIETLTKLAEVGPDGVIVQDLGVAKLIRDHFPSLALHASTQLVAHNLEGVLALKDLGFSRVVLARELSLEEITSIAKRCGNTELEVFIHGALCYSLSGLCLYGAMEKGRSGNRGKCPYCCRQRIEAKGEGKPQMVYPFSMKDLRLGEDVRKLVEAGVASLKIEGRMKSPLYVASVTRYYRNILGEGGETACGKKVTVGDLETVFSRRTTKLYFDGRPSQTSSTTPVDAQSLGHLGTEVGTVKKVTRDREGLFWLRFHASRGLEKHDGLQFDAVDEDGKHLGMGIVEMRQAISRRPVFEVNAGVDVEILVNEELSSALRPGMKVYCSMSNAVKRMFPTPSFRPSDYPGLRTLKVTLTIEKNRVTATEEIGDNSPTASIEGDFKPAKNPEMTHETAVRAFSKLGGTGFRLGSLKLNDPNGLFVPMSCWNDLRRDFMETVSCRRDQIVHDQIEAAKAEFVGVGVGGGVGVGVGVGVDGRVVKRVKIRIGQSVPDGDWDEVIVAINTSVSVETISDIGYSSSTTVPRPRLALPVYTSELDFNKLRTTVKRLLREGYEKWEASDLATLRMLGQLGVKDITADWSLYAFNARALAALAALGVKRFVASPENTRENLQYLAESGYAVEFLSQQSTPLFISLTRPEGEWTTESGEGRIGNDLSVNLKDGLWVTTKRVPRTFRLPNSVSTRLDLSWDPT